MIVIGVKNLFSSICLPFIEYENEIHHTWIFCRSDPKLGSFRLRLLGERGGTVHLGDYHPLYLLPIKARFALDLQREFPTRPQPSRFKTSLLLSDLGPSS